MRATEPNIPGTAPSVINLTPRELTPEQSALLSLGAGIGGVLVWLFVDSFAVAVLFGGVMRTALPMILGTAGKARRIAILLNLIVYGGLLTMLALAYHHRAILALIP